MIRVFENYSRVKTLDLRVGISNHPIGNLPEVGTYTISFTHVVHSGEVMGGFLLLGATTIAIMPPAEGRMSFTFELASANVGASLRLYADSSHATAMKNHVTFHDIHIARGTQRPDIWTPAHADLTPEQIATLPPYGEYKEILPL